MNIIPYRIDVKHFWQDHCFFHRYTWMSCNFPSVNWFRNQSISSERAAEKFQLEKYFIEITKKYEMSSSSLIFPSPKIIFHLSEFFDVLWFMKVSFFKELCFGKWILMPNEIAKEFFRQFVKMPKWNPIFKKTFLANGYLPVWKYYDQKEPFGRPIAQNFAKKNKILTLQS